jgi:sn-glycerol 3-phosphate transport system ATP-binding protein
VCLLDEPLSNLDAQLRAEMRGEIRSLQQRLALTMLFVTHDQTEAMSMADRIILMRAGRVEQCGAPFDLYEKPASTFVARFIGTPPMNVIEIDPGLVPAGDPSLVASPGQPALLIGIRPEDIRFADSGLRAIVGSTEYFGADSVTTCRVGDQALLVRTPGRPRIETGSAVHLCWPASATHYFDKTSGLRCEPPRNELRQRNA